MNIREEVKELILTHGLVPSGGHVVVGLSGGTDSVCLFHILHSLQNELDFTMSAAHLNHRFRPGSAEEDAAYVQKLCDDYKIKLTLRTEDVPKAAAQNNQTPEEAGRIARYRLFAEVCRAVQSQDSPSAGLPRGACAVPRHSARNDNTARHCERSEAIQRPPCIAVAHHADDQAETLLMRILRGTGVNGLAGMSLRRFDESGFEIIRPLLHIRKSDIEEYCKANGLSSRHDHTNDDATYTRNKIRLELLPLMDECSGGTAVRSLSRLADHAGEDKDYFDAIVEGIIHESCQFSGGHTPAGNVPLCDAESSEDLVSADIPLARDAPPCDAESSEDFVSADIPLTVLSDNHPAVVHRLITTIFAKLGLVQDITTAHIEAAYSLIATRRTGSSIDFPGNYKLEISYEKAKFIGGRDSHLRGNDTISSLPRSNSTTSCKDTSVSSLCSATEEPEEPETFPEGVCPPSSDNLSITFDEDALKSAKLNPIWRKWRPGDIMHPNGMSGSKKLQDIFTDMKIPKSERDEIMILADETGNEVLWIPEIRATRLYLPTPGTKQTRVIAIPESQSSHEPNCHSRVTCHSRAGGNL